MFGREGYQYQDDNRRGGNTRKRLVQQMSTASLGQPTRGNGRTSPPQQMGGPPGLYSSSNGQTSPKYCGSEEEEVAVQNKSRAEMMHFNIFSYNDHPNTQSQEVSGRSDRGALPLTPSSPLSMASNGATQRSQPRLPPVVENRSGMAAVYRTTGLPVLTHTDDELARLKPLDKDDLRSRQIDAFASRSDGKLANFDQCIGDTPDSAHRTRKGVALPPLTTRSPTGNGNDMYQNNQQRQNFSVFSHGDTAQANGSARNGQYDNDKVSRVKHIPPSPQHTNDVGYTGMLQGLGDYGGAQALPVHLQRKNEWETPIAVGTSMGLAYDGANGGGGYGAYGNGSKSPRDIHSLPQRSHNQYNNPAYAHDRIGELLGGPSSGSSPPSPQQYQRQQSVPEMSNVSSLKPRTLSPVSTGLAPNDAAREVTPRGIRTQINNDNSSVAPHKRTLLYLMRQEQI